MSCSLIRRDSSIILAEGLSAPEGLAVMRFALAGIRTARRDGLSVGEGPSGRRPDESPDADVGHRSRPVTRRELMTRVLSTHRR